MLQNKDIAKIQEIKILYKDSWIQPDFFFTTNKPFSFYKNFSNFSINKKEWSSCLGYIEIIIYYTIYKHKKYGLSVKEYKAQKKTKREKATAVLKRFRELNLKYN